VTVRSPLCGSVTSDGQSEARRAQQLSTDPRQTVVARTAQFNAEDAEFGQEDAE
jgi:hypothetical protein